MKVLHKGFVIVATPLLFQLGIIAASAAMLFAIDREYKIAWQWREVSIAGSRLMLENFRIAEIIARAWTERNPTIAMGLDRQLNQVDALTKTLEKALSGKAVQDVIDRQSVVQQKKITADLRQMVALAYETLDDKTIAKLLATKKALALDLGTTFSSLRELLKKTETTIIRSQTDQEQLANQQIAILVGALAGTVVVGIGIALFFKQQFRKPVECMLDNIDRMKHNRDLHPPLKGNDEIASFDRAFHNMRQQLAIVSEREKALFDNSTDVICVLTDEQRFSKVNQSCSRMWNYSAEKLIRSRFEHDRWSK